MAKRSSIGFSKLEIASGLVGLLCPIPVVGEAALSVFLYPLVNDIKIFGKSKMANIAASVCIATLARIELYSLIYNPIMNYFLDK